MTSGMRRCLTESSLAVLLLLLAADAASAAQGPGTGAGTTGHFTQLFLAILIYGASALVIGAGLIGALRK